MATTANGFIADSDDDTSWISSETWQRYQELLPQIPVAVIGRKTYELMNDEDFSKDRPYYVMSRRKPETKERLGVTYTKKSPAELLKELDKKGYEEVWLLGGSGLNASFLEDGLINELYLDVEPVLLGKGSQLFSEFSMKKKLKLLEANQITDNTLQLHYEVVNAD